MVLEILINFTSDKLIYQSNYIAITMKRFLFILFAITMFGHNLAIAQEVKTNSSLTTISDENYKLYPTENMWNFIKLDTRTGRMWQVQFSTQGAEYRFQCVLNDYDLSYEEENTTPNRFELYPTQNNYNFILLDKVDGRVWQVQWSFEKEERMVLRIY